MAMGLRANPPARANPGLTHSPAKRPFGSATPWMESASNPLPGHAPDLPSPAAILIYKNPSSSPPFLARAWYAAYAVLWMAVSGECTCLNFRRRGSMARA